MKKKDFWLILLFLISFIPLFDFFRLGLPLTHDGQDHVARIANFYQSLSGGNLIPRWAANLNWGYGHPILMFLYPLPSYVASLFHLLSFSLVDSVKIAFGLSFILSGVFMYLWIKEIWDNQSGFVAGLIYMFTPYRFVDLYVRGALGECWAFVWPPLICYFVLKLSKKLSWSNLAGGSLSLAALILSHNALSLMFLPVIFGYMIFLISCSKQKILNTLYYILYTLFGFALSFFFWFPAIFEAKYTLRDIVTKGSITGFEKFTRLVWSPWNYGGSGNFSVQVGIIQWLGIIIAPLLIWLFWKKKTVICIYLLFLLIYFWFAILLILPVSKILYQTVPLLSNFQFAWRWLSLAIFPPAIFLGAIVYIIPKKSKLIVASCLLLVVLLLNKNYWQAKDFLHKTDSFYTQSYSSPTDTGESAPRWSVRFMEQFPRAHLEVIEGRAMIKEIGRETNRHEYLITVERSTRLVENTLYFPGWQVLIDGQLAEIQFQDPAYRGLMTFYVSEGEHYLVVQFGETKLRQFANLISATGLITVLGVGSVIKLSKR